MQLGKQRTALSNNTTHPLSVMSATHFNRGPAYGMSAEVKSKVRVAKMLGVCMCVREGFRVPHGMVLFQVGDGIESVIGLEKCKGLFASMKNPGTKGEKCTALVQLLSSIPSISQTPSPFNLHVSN